MAPGTPRPEPGDEAGAPDWQALERSVLWSDRPWLGFVLSPSFLAARRLAARVEQTVGEPGRVVVFRPSSPDELRGLLPRLLGPDAEAARCVWIEAVHVDPYGLPPPTPWRRAWEWLLLRTNERRERLLSHVGGGTVFVLHPSLKPLVRAAAPDLWSRRSLLLGPLPPAEDVGGEGELPERDLRLPASAPPPDPEMALAAADRAAGEDEGSRVAEGRARLRAGEGLLARGAAGRAADQLGRAADLLLPRPGEQAEALALLAEALAEAGEPDRAASAMERAWEAGAPGDLWRRLVWSDRRGRIEVARGDLVAAEEAYRDCVEAAEAAGDRKGLAGALEWLAGVCARRGDVDGAASCLERGVRVRRELAAEEHPPGAEHRALAVVAGKLGDVRAEQGDPAAAAAQVEEAAETRRRAAGWGRRGPAALYDALVSATRLERVRTWTGDEQGAARAATEAGSVASRLAEEHFGTEHGGRARLWLERRRPETPSPALAQSADARYGGASMPSELRWLHLSDLHLGCRGEEVWWLVHDELKRSLLDSVEHVGGEPHALLLTGDLVFSGAPEQYDLLDRFLDELRGWLDCDPVVVAVPGNHDVARPAARAARAYGWVRQYREETADVLDVHRQLWTERDVEPVAPLLAGYADWAERRLLLDLKARGALRQASWFPGDLSVELIGDGELSVLVVGLNSAWAQVDRGDFRERLLLEPAQLHAALASADVPGSPLAGLGEGRALLLLHHPPAWLDRTSRRRFSEEVYPSRWFDACLYGHLHAGRTELSGRGGERPRCWVQAPSLFGLEEYGTAREARAMGYLWGALDEHAGLRVWPLVRRVRDGGGAFVPDHERFELADGRCARLRRPEAPAPAPAGADRQATPPEVVAGLASDHPEYRRWTGDRFGHLDLLGLDAGDLRIRMDDVYVDLEVSVRARLGAGREGKLCRGEELSEHGEQDVALDEVFERAGAGRHVLILGDPGAGKTTALRKLLQRVLDDGGEAVGLPAGTLPVFLRLRRLTAGDLARPFSAFVQRELDELAGPGTFAGLGEALWDRGRLLLLLDGLDELPDSAHRAAVCRYVDAVLGGAAGREVRAAVSCRYAGYQGEVEFSGAFLPLDVRSLTREWREELVRRWFFAAGRAREPGDRDFSEVDEESAVAARELNEALAVRDRAAQALVTLVGTPLMLTLLCLVVMRGGKIPRRRTRFYEEALEVLLSRWRRGAGATPPLDRDQALDLLRLVAWTLHEAGRRDDLTGTELAGLAERALAPHRAHLGEVDPEGLREWLVVDAGVLAEYARGQYGFAHLGLQEYLAALEAARRGGETARAVGGRIAEEWWQEVVLLAVGQPHHDVFAEVVGGALAAGALPEHAGLVGRALEEAHVARVEPFAKLIAAPGTPVRARAEALRLFMARRDAVVVEAARAFVEDADADVRELARGLTAWEPPEAPAPEAVEAGEAVALDLGEGVALALLPVPGGTFEMGEDASPHDDEKPAHAVTVPGFLLGETPVTNAQYGRFLAEAGHREPPRWSDARFSGPEQPVVTVSWDDARAFCRWLGGRAGLEVDLPTEARWERAARGEDGRRYPWGDEEPDETRVVFGRSRDKGTTEPVGSRPAGRGAYGHLDLAGNVWEWCLDDCDTGAYARRAGEVVEDPRCRVEGQGSRIGRGGSWLNAAESLRSAFRYWRPAGGRLDNIGFRVCAAPASTVR